MSGRRRRDGAPAPGFAACVGDGVAFLPLAWSLILALCGCGETLPPPEPNGERAFRDLQQQVDMGPRVAGSSALVQCRAYIVKTLQDHAAQVRQQPFRVEDPYGEGKLDFLNILGIYYPQRSYRFLLGAHYDSRPRADQESLEVEVPIPGANDGASGVAVLLEVARALQEWDPGIGVDLVFFDGEDYGKEGDLDYYLLGSKQFVEMMGDYRPRGMILLDMVGDRDLRIPIEQYSQRMAPRLTRLVFDVADSLAAPGFVSEPGLPIYDDHIPFLQQGIPAVDLIDFDYPAWHTRRDTADRCAPASLETVTRVVLHVLLHLGRQQSP